MTRNPPNASCRDVNTEQRDKTKKVQKPREDDDMKNARIAREIAEDLAAACCVSGIRDASGRFKRVFDEEALTEKIARRVKAILDRGRAEPLESESIFPDDATDPLRNGNVGVISSNAEDETP